MRWWPGEHEFCRWFSPIDLTHWVFNCREDRTGSTWESILANRGLPEFDGMAIWIAVEVYICHAHCAFYTVVLHADRRKIV